MSPGKIASQAGHAYLGTFLNCQAFQPELLADYLKDFPGTKICLRANSLEALDRAHAEAIASGIPHSLITDSGCPNFFDGRPIITALGLGPSNELNIKHIT